MGDVQPYLLPHRVLTRIALNCGGNLLIQRGDKMTTALIAILLAWGAAELVPLLADKLARQDMEDKK